MSHLDEDFWSVDHADRSHETGRDSQRVGRL